MRNTTKGLSYAEAWRRIKAGIEEGHYFESVTLEEGIIADRLLSFIKGAEPIGKVGVSTNFGILIGHWRRLVPDLPTDDDGRDLGSRVDVWRKRRNECVHGLVKSEPGQPTKPVAVFIANCENVALDGQLLAREVQDWHRRRLRGEPSK